MGFDLLPGSQGMSLSITHSVCRSSVLCAPPHYNPPLPNPPGPMVGNLWAPWLSFNCLWHKAAEEMGH